MTPLCLCLSVSVSLCVLRNAQPNPASRPVREQRLGADAMATTEEDDPLSLCVEILKDGYADAFIQFFSLS